MLSFAPTNWYRGPGKLRRVPFSCPWSWFLRLRFLSFRDRERLVDAIPERRPRTVQYWMSSTARGNNADREKSGIEGRKLAMGRLSVSVAFCRLCTRMRRNRRLPKREASRREVRGDTFVFERADSIARGNQVATVGANSVGERERERGEHRCSFCRDAQWNYQGVSVTSRSGRLVRAPSRFGGRCCCGRFTPKEKDPMG